MMNEARERAEKAEAELERLRAIEQAARDMLRWFDGDPQAGTALVALRAALSPEVGQE